MDARFRQQLIDQLQRMLLDLDDELASKRARMNELTKELAQTSEVRDKCQDMLEALLGNSPSTVGLGSGARTPMPLVDAIDFAIQRAPDGIDRATLLGFLISLAKKGSLQKVPSDASLRAMLSQYAPQRGWLKDAKGRYRIAPPEFSDVPEEPDDEDDPDRNRS